MAYRLNWELVPEPPNHRQLRLFAIAPHVNGATIFYFPDTEPEGEAMRTI